MKKEFYFEDLKSDYKIMTSICVHIDVLMLTALLPDIKNSIRISELQKILKEINKLSEDFKNKYHEIPWATIVTKGERILTEVENDNLFPELKKLLKEFNEEINELSYQEIKKMKPKWSTDYKNPIKSKSSVKPVRK